MCFPQSPSKSLLSASTVYGIILSLLLLLFFHTNLWAQSTKRDSLALKISERIEQLILQDSLNRVQLQQALLEYQQLDQEDEESMAMVPIDSATESDISKKEDHLVKLPVVPFENDTIFFLSDTSRTIALEQRKIITEGNIRYIVDHYLYFEDSLKVIHRPRLSKIVYRDTVLLRLSEYDALLADTLLRPMAENYRRAIHKSIKKNVTQRNLISFGMGLALLIGLYFFIRIIRRSFRWMAEKMWSNREEWFKTIKYKGVDFLNAQQQETIVRRFLKLLEYAVLLLVLYLFLPLLFSVFPPAQRIADKLFGFIWSPVKAVVAAVLDYLPNLFFILVIVLVFRYMIRAIKAVFNEIKVGKIKISGFYAEWAKPTYNIIAFLLYSFMMVLIFPYLPGSQSEAFKGISVFVGVLISIGSSSAITNSIAGIVITYMRPFTIGDWIEVDGIRGELIERSMFVIRMRTNENKIMTIPNSSVLSNNTINLSMSNQRFKLIIHTEVTIGYDVPWRRVRDLLIRSAQETDGILQDPRPFVLTTQLNDFYIEYSIRCCTNYPAKIPRTLALLNQNILDNFNRGGVEILSPHFRAQRKGEDITIINQKDYPEMWDIGDSGEEDSAPKS
ncbi:mechanosensitive ion channel family protein [Persicobacter diffluens]|uniref:Mechanosensitive ion channel protein MscS n=1 Tax=Persicobacter diffluens TaxID=981 RepID=A0AAN4VXT5_9BACT|nr:mechanosensitive ion channel protein MscS [Persicobacter diffluens]